MPTPARVDCQRQGTCAVHLSYVDNLELDAEFHCQTSTVKRQIMNAIAASRGDDGLAALAAAYSHRASASTVGDDLARLLASGAFADREIAVPSTADDLGTSGSPPRLSGAPHAASAAAGAGSARGSVAWTVFDVHSAVLACRSEYFEGLWTRDFREKNERQLRVTGLQWANPASMRQFLGVVYGKHLTSDADSSSQQVQQAVFHAATYYGMYSYGWMNGAASQEPEKLVPALCSAINQVAATGAPGMGRVWGAALEWLHRRVMARPLGHAAAPGQGLAPGGGDTREVREQLLRSMPESAVTCVLERLWSTT